MLDGQKWLDGNDNPGATRVDNGLGAFEGGIGALQGGLGGGDAELSLSLDVLQDPERQPDADIAEDDKNEKGSPEHLVVPGPWSRLRGRGSDDNLGRLRDGDVCDGSGALLLKPEADLVGVVCGAFETTCGGDSVSS